MAEVKRALAALAMLTALTRPALSAAASPADCWQALKASHQSPHIRLRLWTCADRALPASARSHGAAFIRPLVIDSGDSVWVIDPGGTRDQAQALRAALADAQDARKQLVVVNSRAQAEYVMASDALVRNWTGGQAKQISLPETARLMKQRCVPCQQRLQRELGRHAMQGTRIRIPEGLPAERWPDRTLVQAQAAQGAAIEEDAWLHAPDYAWVWVGTLLGSHLPDLQQGQVDARMAVLEQFASIASRHPDTLWISSTGVVTAARIQEELQYFTRWQSAARQALEEGISALEALVILRDRVEPLRRTDTADQTLHDFNLQRIIRQTEEASLR